MTDQEKHQGEPVALPARREVERIHEPHDVPEVHEAIGFNTCLDEIAKLGPLYTHPAPAAQQERLTPKCTVLKDASVRYSTSSVETANDRSAICPQMSAKDYLWDATKDVVMVYRSIEREVVANGQMSVPFERFQMLAAALNQYFSAKLDAQLKGVKS
jgi:hypothetical protein